MTNFYSNRRVCELFRRHATLHKPCNNCATKVACDTLHERHLRPVLNSLGLFPTRAQIRELVHCACEMSGRVPADHVTFGEFSLLVSQLQHLYTQQQPIHNKPPRSQLTAKAIDALNERRNQRRFSGDACPFQVFLGGSCNPTTWRDDVAIPYFNQHNITFYNPQQVNCWRPELMAIEDQAKQTAEVLFFVIDNQTRSVASIVEAAYLAGCGRQLILVIKPLDCQVIVAGETLLDGETEDLQRSHAYLTDIVERMSIPVFTDLHKALECTKIALKTNVNIKDLSCEDGAQPVRFPHLHLTHQLIKLRNIFRDLDTTQSGRICYADVCNAYKSITGSDLPDGTVVPVICADCATATDPVVDARSLTLSFDEFCCIVSEHQYKTQQSQSIVQWLINNLWKLMQQSINWLKHWLDQEHLTASAMAATGELMRVRDVYLGGSCGHSRWRDEIAGPLLREHGVTFYNPQLTAETCWTDSRIALELAMKESCRILLFVITSDTRSITNMLEAAHYIGRGCNIVLCVQSIQYGSCIDVELPCSQPAVDDYNRARAYLADIASRDGVPVLADIYDAVLCAVNRLHLT